MDLQKRYSDALKRIGGTTGLLSLPKDVQDILKSVTDLEKKVKILEAIAFMAERLKAEEEAEKEEPCEYCRMEPNGDIPEDRKDLFNIKIGRVFDHDALLSVCIVKNRMDLIGGNNYCKNIKIHYCPMCGRKL